MKKWTPVVVLLIVAAAAAIYGWRFYTSPEYSLMRIQRSVEEHDITSFEHYVDVEGVVLRLLAELPGVFSGHEAAKLVGEGALRLFEEFAKETIVRSVKTAVATFIERGHLDRELTDDGVLAKFAKEVQIDNIDFVRLKGIRQEGKIAYVSVVLHIGTYNGEVDATFMMRDKGSYWQIAELRLREFVDQIELLRRRYFHTNVPAAVNLVLERVAADPRYLDPKDIAKVKFALARFLATRGKKSEARKVLASITPRCEELFNEGRWSAPAWCEGEYVILASVLDGSEAAAARWQEALGNVQAKELFHADVLESVWGALSGDEILRATDRIQYKEYRLAALLSIVRFLRMRHDEATAAEAATEGWRVWRELEPGDENSVCEDGVDLWFELSELGDAEHAARVLSRIGDFQLPHYNSCHEYLKQVRAVVAIIAGGDPATVIKGTFFDEFWRVYGVARMLSEKEQYEHAIAAANIAVQLINDASSLRTLMTFARWNLRSDELEKRIRDSLADSSFKDALDFENRYVAFDLEGLRQVGAPRDLDWLNVGREWADQGEYAAALDVLRFGNGDRQRDALLDVVQSGLRLASDESKERAFASKLSSFLGIPSP